MARDNNPHSTTNQFDLARDTFNLLRAMLDDSQKVKEAYTQISNMTSDTLRTVLEQDSSLKQIKAQLDTIRTQQAEIILEAKLIHRDLDVLLDLFGDVATYSKEDKPQKRRVYGDAG